jgi:uncharacterized membrane protein HdeD (DUF308 family)
MPLPTPPTRSPNNKNTRQSANNDLMIKGVLCVLTGLVVLVTPYFVTSPGMQSIVGQSQLVGWFALVLGIAFLGVYVRRRLAAAKG